MATHASVNRSVSCFPIEKLEKERAGKSQLSGKNDNACGEPVFHPDILQEVAHSWQELVS
jgi:hypothetical protein